MVPTRSDDADQPEARDALLDATQRLMLSDGYAAVTSRRVAAEAGVNAGLVYYYFGPMDNLFVEVFRRSAARMLEQQAEALGADQPLWALWDLIRDQTTELNRITEHLAELMMDAALRSALESRRAEDL